MVKSDSFFFTFSVSISFENFSAIRSKTKKKKASDIIKGVLGIPKHTPLHYGTKTYEEIDGK